MTTKEAIAEFEKLPVAERARALVQVILNLSEIAEDEVMVSQGDIETVCETILQSVKS